MWMPLLALTALALAPVAYGQGCDGNSCCTVRGACGVNEGDCDRDSECQLGLACGDDNCNGATFNGATFESGDDCCHGTPTACTSPCLTCTTDATTCASCIDGHFLSGTDCSGTCKSGCKECVDATHCTKCKPQLVQRGDGSCQVCKSGCQECVDEGTNCTICIPRYINMGDGSCQGPVYTCPAGTSGGNGPPSSGSKDKSDCRNADDELGLKYKGKYDFTISGKRCQAWSAQTPHKHNKGENGENMAYWNELQQSPSEAQNFCRNPDGYSGGLWCYTMDENTLWELCYVPICNGALCHMPTHIENGYLLPIAPTIELDMEYTLICNPGFIISETLMSSKGVSSSQRDSQFLQCQSNGRLTNRGVYCMDCPTENWWPDGVNTWVLDVLNGYNYRKGDPFEEVDPGFSGNRIFDLLAKDSSGCDIQRLDDGFTINEFTSCSSKLSSKVYRTYEQMRSDREEESSTSRGFRIGVDQDVTLSAGAKGVSAESSFNVPAPFKKSWTESSSMTEAREFFRSGGGSMVITEVECAKKRVQLNMNTLPEFSSAFKNALLHLNEQNYRDCEKQKSAFRAFVGDYGTHFFSKMVFGAQLLSVFKYSASETKENSESTLKACSSKAMSVNMGILFGYDKSSNKCDKTGNSNSRGDSNSQSEYKQVTKGTGSKVDIKNWNDVEITPEPLHYELRPIANLFADKHLEKQRGLSQIDGQKLREWFIPMYFDYCTVMGIDCPDPCALPYCAECKEDLTQCARCNEGAIKNTINGKEVCIQVPCNPNPCLNGGSCRDGECTCLEGFNGDKCQMKVKDNWVTAVLGYSTQYESDALDDASSYHASQVIGMYDVYPNYGDEAGAWAHAASEMSQQHILVKVEKPIIVTGIRIYETHSGGAITRISLEDSGGAWITVWSHKVTGTTRHVYNNASRVFSPVLKVTSFATQKVKIEMDCSGGFIWCEIDAINVLSSADTS